ncbi:PAS domain-containing protein [Chondromyces crocatus]|uniref:PAS domain-containing protein n=1 Tax=Chondromyces crocatus TaxID=52 RepID=UPI0012E32AB9|nr:PAS domain-containing protein [Chondromyces crocatus]
MLDSFFSTCPELLFVATLDAKLQLSSAAMRRHLGAGGEPGVHLLDLIHPEDKPVFETAWARLSSSTTPERLDVRLRDTHGVFTMVRCHAARTEDGTAIHGAFRLEAVCPPRTKELLLDAMAENLPAAIWGCSGDGTLVYQEGKALEMLGVKRGEFVGQNLLDLYGNVEGLGEYVRRALAGESIHYLTYLQGFHWENWLIPIFDAHGERVMILGFTIDITRVRKAEEELRLRLTEIEHQQEVIRRLSTPIIEVWDGVLTLPMLGVLDSTRTAEVMDNLLDRVAQSQARYAILDLTGVEVVDTGVAGYLLRLVNAIRLLGAEGIVAGIRPTVAQTMITLGADLSQIVTHRNLRAALSHCIRQMSSPSPSTPRPHD